MNSIPFVDTFRLGDVGDIPGSEIILVKDLIGVSMTSSSWVESYPETELSS